MSWWVSRIQYIICNLQLKMKKKSLLNTLQCKKIPLSVTLQIFVYIIHMYIGQKKLAKKENEM